MSFEMLPGVGVMSPSVFCELFKVTPEEHRQLTTSLSSEGLIERGKWPVEKAYLELRYVRSHG